MRPAGAGGEMAASILLVEDEPQHARHLAQAFAAAGTQFTLAIVDTVRKALGHLGCQPVDCVLLDYRLPDSEGLSALRAIRLNHPDVPVVMLTGAGCEEIAVDAMKLGAADYIVKHGSYVDGVPGAVREALGCRAMQRVEPTSTSAPGRALSLELRERYRGNGIIGESVALETALALATRASNTNVTVLLEGETGTGKELFARSIHAHSARHAGPFIAVNCAAIPEPLLESELFGHVRGAFSGADRDRCGLFEEASGGTLFLDESGEIPPPMQAKLLRVLQGNEIRPVGSSRSRAVDVRVVAGTNRDLQLLVREGRFRLDLYHRLNVFPIRLPALRDRRSDVPLLARHFLQRFAERERKEPLAMDPEVIQILAGHVWPGNVRELSNEVHRLVLCAEPGGRIDVSMLSPSLASKAAAARGDARPLKEIVREVELATIAARLREHGYRRAATARSLGLTREGLWQKLRQLGLKPRSRDVEPIT